MDRTGMPDSAAENSLSATVTMSIFTVFLSNLYKSIKGREKCWALGSVVMLQSNKWLNRKSYI